MAKEGAVVSKEMRGCRRELAADDKSTRDEEKQGWNQVQRGVRQGYWYRTRNGVDVTTID
jgi:hypothetical protein